MRSLYILCSSLVIALVISLFSVLPAQAQVPQIQIPQFVQQVVGFLSGTRPELVPQPVDERPQVLYAPEVVIAEPVNGDLMLAGGRVDINAPVDGDVMVAGGLVQINAPVSGTVMVVAGLTNMTGRVGNDVRLASVAANFDNVIDDNVLVAAVFLRQAARSEFSGSLMAWAYRAWLSGVIGGNVNMQAEHLALDAAVGGTMRLSARNLEIQQNTIVLEDLVASVSAEPAVSPNAQLRGSVEIIIQQTATESALEATPGATLVPEVTPQAPEVQEAEGQTSWWPSLVGTVHAQDDSAVENRVDAAKRDAQVEEFRVGLGKFLRDVLIIFIGGSVILWLMPGFQRGMVQAIRRKPFPTLTTGLLWITMGLVLAIILLVTIIGIPLGILVILLWVLSFIMAPWAVAQAVGGLISRNWQSPHYRNEYIHILLGALVVVLLMRLPIFGWIATMIIWLFGMGAPVYWLLNRPKKGESGIEAETVVTATNEPVQVILELEDDKPKKSKKSSKKTSASASKAKATKTVSAPKKTAAKTTKTAKSPKKTASKAK